MRILMSLALGLACTGGVFAADQGTTPGVGGDHSAAASQQPINTVDPVTGKPIDATLPAVLVPNAQVTAGSSPGMSGGASGSSEGVQGQQQQWVAIGISEQSSAEQIRANPHKFLQAARLNRKAQEGMVGAGSSSGLESGSELEQPAGGSHESSGSGAHDHSAGGASTGSSTDWNQSGQSSGGESMESQPAAEQDSGQSQPDANAPAHELPKSGQSADNGQAGSAPGMESPSSIGGEMNESSSSGGAATESTLPDAAQPVPAEPQPLQPAPAQPSPAQPEAGSASGSSSLELEDDGKPDVDTTTGSGADLSGNVDQEKIDEAQAK